MGTSLGREPLHPGVLDPQFLLEEGQLVLEAVDLGLEAGGSAPRRAARATIAVKA
jgi:hypothetical protein